MDNIIVYVDDAAYGLQLLQPMLQGTGSDAPARWIVVGCPPRMTHHVSKWLARSSRDSWRGKWAEKVFAQLVPALANNGDEVKTCMAKADLCSQTASLIKQHGQARILDARRPKFGEDLQPVTATQAQERQGTVGYFAAVASAGLLVATD
jgi:hypothetical protein